MYLPRNIDKELENWKADSRRKPLLIRGARQVGKTHSIRQLGKQFSNYIEINFEESPRLKDLFSGDLNPDIICEDIAAIFRTRIIPDETLLFLDEIQECQEAIASLRFFYEKMPDLHVIAAGSLLEFALSEIPTFGVGRIRSMFMYPLSFSEFLNGAGEEQLLLKIREASPHKPLNEALHARLNEYIRKFFYLGGMPEVIAAYIEKGDLIECQQLLNDLIISFQADFAKYRKRTPVSMLNEVFQAVVYQAGRKFVYAKACTQASHSQVKDALQKLIMAGLVIPVTHSASNGLPLGAEANLRKQKMLVFDIGIFQRLMGLEMEDFLLSGSFNAINKGNLAEQFAGLELIKSESCYQVPSLYYWHREAKSSNAEVDYVIPIAGEIVPVEVKAGTKGAMQSMYIFLEEKKLNRGIRLSNENFSVFGQIDVYPLYAIENLEAINI